ncbi:YolD-like family protein [Paenibacillus oralis]|uniref:YolD-like family protein n=1 Tax=Paenibacillus oralis TaxID=2490856 RepID=A0A3P3T9P4_9BACL|nr:YolD-like family protein [Paenibacillus oralis]RRJ54775.1 YolD-like family protein [Paenibacillus oralis]
MNDRGRIKWSPFLIPEHKKLIAQFYESEEDVNQPELDEQVLEILQETIQNAIELCSEVRINYYRGRRNRSIYGTIKKVDPLTKVLTIAEVDGAEFRIPFQEITDIDIV